MDGLLITLDYGICCVCVNYRKTTLGLLDYLSVYEYYFDFLFL